MKKIAQEYHARIIPYRKLWTIMILKLSKTLSFEFSTLLRNNNIASQNLYIQNLDVLHTCGREVPY